MDNEAIERNIQFIIGQQAQFAADMQEMRQALAEYEARSRQRMDQLTDAVVGLTGIVGRLIEGQEQLVHSQQAANDRLNALIEESGSTNDRLNALITLFERHIQENHNGRKLPPQ